MSKVINILAELEHILQGTTKEQEIIIEIPKNMDFGDLTTNIAMKLAKKRKQDPFELANNIIDKLKDNKFINKNFVKIEAQRPGFINFFYSNDLISEEFSKSISKKDYGKNDLGKKKKVVIEYSSPNTNKPLHVGHLRNNAIGMALSNLMEYLGYKVVKTEVVNDRGVHIMKSMWAYMKYGEGKTPESEDIKPDKFVGDYYVKYSQAEKDNPELKSEIQEMLVKWEKGDKEITDLWEKMNKWAYKGWEKTYETYGSEFDIKYYESDLYDKGRDIIKKAAQDDIVKENKEGAYVIDLSEYGLGGRESGEKILLRPDGTTVYMTQDVYLASKRYKDYKFDQLFYVVGDEQIYHFQVLFKILEKLGFPWHDKLNHFHYAHVLLPEGKMKSREGKVVDGDDLLNEMYELAGQEINKRDKTINEKDKNERAWGIGLAAIKYWMLKSNQKSELHFDPKDSLDFEGNTGSYILYAYVRLLKILEKGSYKKYKKIDKEFGEEEKTIIRKIMQWPIVVNNFSKNYSINFVCDYVFQFSSLINNYYQKVSVIKSDEDTKKMRLEIINSSSDLIKNILGLLNIKTINKM